MSDLIKTPAEIIAALQSAASTATNKITPQQVMELHNLLLTAASLLQRTSEALDRVDKLMVIAEPAIATIDRIAPMLEDVANSGNDLRNAIANVPGLGRLKSD
jgi:hypothetical protein